MKISIDVIIPSFRPDEKYILPSLQLKRPQNTSVKFFLIIDNPSISVPASIQSLINNKDIFLLINEKNMGASETRNTGIAAGSGEWILFLDDDIAVQEDLLQAYADSIHLYPGEIGFIGLVKFPQPTTDFTRAIVATGSMDIFSIAKRKKTFAWGATANIMVRRVALGDNKFSNFYPKSGGGEDVDFFLRVRENNNYKNFKTLADAVVQHPWWNKEAVDFKRPFRYGKGNSLLGYLNRQYTYYDFLNTVETLFISFIFLLISAAIKTSFVLPLLYFIAGVIIIEIIASSIQTIKRSKKINLKVIGFVIALRFVQDYGLLYGKISRLQFWRIGERFHDDGSINKLNFYRTNTYKIAKWILYVLLIFYLLTR